VLVPSPRDVTTYDQKPEMSAHGVTDAVLKALDSRQYDAVIINYANGDMVGHTGSLPAAIKAVECVDACVGQVVEATLKLGGSLIVTADHGNCEQMIDPATGGPHTAHTTYPVELIVVDPRFHRLKTGATPDHRLKTGAPLTPHPSATPGQTLRSGGRLADIAPTALQMMGISKPAEMTGESLIESSI